MRTWGITDIGLVRKENQDAYDIRLVDNYTAAVVCDGMVAPTVVGWPVPPRWRPSRRSWEVPSSRV